MDENCWGLLYDVLGRYGDLKAVLFRGLVNKFGELIPLLRQIGKLSLLK